jgi:hypothetical protein
VVALSNQIRLWKITDKGFDELKSGSVEQEKKLHDWLEGNVSLISDDLLVIGREVPTDFNRSIDLLCLDRNGDVVIIELKRGRAPRDVLAQILEYASWADDLPSERILDIANEYLQKKGTTLEEAFQQKFGTPLPEFLNDSHKMLIVASELDAQTERVLNYLSEHGIDINAVTFSYFRDGKNEYVARVLLIPESMKETVRPPSKRVQKTRWTAELLREQIDVVSKEKLRKRLSEILNFALEKNIFAESTSKGPQFSLSVQNTGGKVLAISFDGTLYAYFGLSEVKKYPAEEVRRRFVNDLKRLNLLPANINPDEVKSGRILERRLDEFTDDEFTELLKSLECNLISKSTSLA